MITIVDEFFGEPAQQALQRRSEHVWTLLNDAPVLLSRARIWHG